MNETHETLHTHLLLHTLTPVMTCLAYFGLRLATQPRVTMALKSNGTCVSYTPSISGDDSWVASSLQVCVCVFNTTYKLLLA